MSQPTTSGMAGLAREWERIRRDLTIAAVQFQRFLEEDVPRYVARLEELVQAVQIRADKMLLAHSALKQKGYLPSVPLLAVSNRGDVEFEPMEVAHLYATALKHSGLSDGAERMERVGKVVAVGEHELSLRAIFPEIERIAREKTYEADVMEGITSLPSLRMAVNALCLKRSLKEALYAYVKIDLFVLTSISAFDYAYASTPKPGKHPKPETHLYRRTFRKVPNRHVAAHGLPGSYDQVHVINALTLLYVMVGIGAVFMELEERIPATPPKNFDVALKEWREGRRAMNRSFRRLWKTVKGREVRSF